MAVNPTYPGVYIEEIPSGVHTIAGVATSITAFIGRAPRGSLDDPAAINSFADFERGFGGLMSGYPMSYAVRDFYGNGGSQAVIVRVAAGATRAALHLGPLSLQAASEGSWGNSLRARVDTSGITDDVAHTIDPTFTAADLFNLTIRDMATGVTEQFRNLTGKESPRRVDRVLQSASQLVQVATAPSNTPPPFPVPPANGDPAPGHSIWDDDTASTKVADTDHGSDGNALGSGDYIGSQNDKTGIFALAKTDLFNLLCIPPDTRNGNTPNDVYAAAMQYCAARRAMLIVDAPIEWGNGRPSDINAASLQALGLSGVGARNAALYFPRVIEADPLRGGQSDTFPASGMIAGAMARTDAQRGVWKAPAGIDAGLAGIQALQVSLTDAENGQLNPLGINCLRSFPLVGPVVWGARTLRGADQLADEYKYIPIRRLALYIEESLYRGTQWAVFEPNDEPLWSQIRLNVGAFMQNLFRQGAFQGASPRDAYFVKCDKDTTTQNDINLGIVNILVGFAPLKPAEFVIIQIQQMAGQVQA